MSPLINTHRFLCRQMAHWFSRQPWCDISCWELAYNDGFVDALGISSVLSSTSTPRISIAEVKRTKADLLQDIRSRKMLKYEANSTHCYLAGTAAALCFSPDDDRSTFQFLLEEGLPLSWGVILLPTRGWKPPIVLRNARSIGKVNEHFQNVLTARIGISLSQRILDKNSPLTEKG